MVTLQFSNSEFVDSIYIGTLQTKCSCGMAFDSLSCLCLSTHKFFNYEFVDSVNLHISVAKVFQWFLCSVDVDALLVLGIPPCNHEKQCIVSCFSPLLWCQAAEAKKAKKDKKVLDKKDKKGKKKKDDQKDMAEPKPKKHKKEEAEEAEPEISDIDVDGSGSSWGTSSSDDSTSE